MRLLRLNLLRYGAFTDRALHFRPEARLHVVYGPNEAGKSSALASLSDLLFGFTHTAEFNFLHEAPTLRIGAAVRAQDGTELSFRRRRGRKDTLLSDEEGEAPLRDDALSPYLGNLSRAVFERAFGLDSERLRQGSQAMLDADGEAGGMLFAASAGILGLRQIKSTLDEEAEALFAPRASSRTFNQILARQRDAWQSERKSELGASHWKTLNDGIDELAARHAEKLAERARLRQRQEEIARLQQLRPLVDEIDRNSVALAAFDDLAGLPEGLGRQTAEALSVFADKEQRLSAAGEALEKAAAAHAAIRVDASHLAHAEEIAALFAQSTDYANKLRDMPRIVEERDEYSHELCGLARRLGLARQEMDRIQPSDAVLARVAERLGQSRQASDDLAALENRIADDEAQLRRLDDARPQAPILDPKPWRERLDGLGADLETLRERDARRARLDAEWRRIREAAARLDPPVADLDAMATASLPDESLLISLREEMANLRQRERAHAERREQESAEIAAIDAETSAEARIGAVASRQAIEEARHERDALFGEIADPLKGAAALPAPEAGEAVLRRYLSLARAADALADVAISHADRASAQAARLRRRDDLVQSVAKINAAIGACGDDLARLRQRYEAPFRAIDLVPGEPDRMISWLRSLHGLLDARQAALAEAELVAAADRLERELRPALEGIADGIGLARGVPLPVTTLARTIGERLRQLAENWDANRDEEARRRDAARRLETLQGQRMAALEAAESARAALTVEAKAVGLEEAGGHAEIGAALDIWAKVPSIRREEDNRERRVAGMTRDVKIFETAVGALAERLAPELSGLGPADAIRALNEAAQAARTADLLEKHAQEALAEAREREAVAVAALDKARQRLAVLTADCPAETDASALAARLTERDRLSESLAECRSRFRQIVPEEAEETIRAALETFDRAQAEAELAALRDAEQQVDAEIMELSARLAEQRSRRDALGTANGAELAAFERRAAEAELVEVARNWAVLKLASQLLGAAMEKQRAAQTNPMLERAGRYFAAISDGAFSGLSQHFDDNDRPVISAVRAGSGTVRPSGMSDGTRDQLYLALRLSYLEDYALRNEPVPFIADDIFQTFDDARTLAALKVLADAGGSMQPIVFTHHRSVADLARRAVGNDLDLVEL